MSSTKTPKKLAVRRLQSSRPFIALLDQVFFIFAGLASFWLAWLVLREGWATGGWWLVGLFFVVWAIVSYIALPRLHRILSNVYVPNYFIGRTRTADGILSDPVNLSVRGPEEKLHKAMTTAGWALADDITPRSAWRMILTTLGRRSYPNAPVSPAFLFGRRQDFAYQQEVDGNPTRRHHVRFWRCPDGWLLPGGHRVDWLAAGSYDKSVGLSLFTFQLTHKIDENIDIERDYIIESVKNSEKYIRVTVLKDFSTGYHSRNGHGDSIRTDGDLPILEVGRVKLDRPVTTLKRFGIIMDGTIHDRHPRNHETLIEELWSRRPPQILIGSGLMVLVSLFTIGQTMVNFSSWPELLAQVTNIEQIDINLANTILSIISDLNLLLVVVELVLVGLLLRGSSRARISLLAVATLAIITESLSVTIERINMSTVFLLTSIGVHIMIMMLFSSDAARYFTDRRRN